MKPGKLRDRLIEGRAMAELSRVLVQLKEDCPLPMALDDFKLEQVPKEPLAEFLTAHGFTSLLKRLDDGKGSPDRRPSSTRRSRTLAGARPAPTGNRQPRPNGRRSTARLRRPSSRSSGSSTGSPAPSPRARWRSTPRPATSTRCAPS
jgi:hypothetical protein